MADLIETLLHDPEEGPAALYAHLDRMKASARALGFIHDAHAAGNEVQAVTFRLRAPKRIRMRLSPGGAFAIALDEPPVTPAQVAARIVPLPIDPADPRLRHKTSDRAFYDAARDEAGTFEVVFARADGLLTEGSFTNLFVRAADGRLRTPPLERGLLPGVLRARLILEERAYEDDLTAVDLADGFFLGNSLRGLIAATLA